MRRFLHILLLLLPLLSCTHAMEQEPLTVLLDEEPDGCVTITFTCAMPVNEAATKADDPEVVDLGEESRLQTMHLAVFGGSGYFKEYITATRVLRAGETEDKPLQQEKTFMAEDGSSYSKKVDTYQFQANLKLSNTPRTIHFLGNGPSSIRTGKADATLPDSLGRLGTAFWQMITLPAIKARTCKKKVTDPETGQQVEVEYYVKPGGGERGPNDDYVVSDTTANYFTSGKPLYDMETGEPLKDENGHVVQSEGIALIRNWSKIILKNMEKKDSQESSNFTPISFAVINVPEKGTVVPYGGKTGFIPNYQKLSFDQLFDPEGNYAYKGNLPQGTAFNTTVPPDEAFENPEAAANLKWKVKKYNPEFDAYSISYNSELDPDTEPAVYLYERPVPSEKIPPSYVIVYGRYLNPKDPIFKTTHKNPFTGNALTDEEESKGILCYYKVDLMANGEYYPIYRNFKYQVIIQKITAIGRATALEASVSAGSADVSADINASGLPDISDGTRRMAVSPWMSKTFIDGVSDVTTKQLYVVFYDNINQDDEEDAGAGSGTGEIDTGGVNMKYASVWCEHVSGDHVVQSISIDHPMGSYQDSDGAWKYYSKEEYETNTGETDYGWRAIRFGIIEPDEYVSKTQTLRIKCKTRLDDPEDKIETPLYRDIVITVQPRQEMLVKCAYDKVIRKIGKKQVVNISIPDGLVESMFPLVFTIEPENMTLTPDISEGINLPVVYGKSIKPLQEGETAKPAFHFQRTLSWSDYNSITPKVNLEDERRWRTFPTYFTTNCENSGTTIWVENHFFRPGNTSFSDYRSFDSPQFTTSIPRSDGASVKMSAGVQKELIDGVMAYKKVYALLTNLEPENDAVTITDNENYGEGQYENGVWSFTPLKDVFVLPFKTKAGANGNVSVKLYTDDDSYEAVSLSPWRFTQVGFINTHALPSKPTDRWGSNAVFGRVNSQSKNVLFGFCVDPAEPIPTISFNKVGVTYNNDKPLVLKNNKMHGNSYRGHDDFYWAEMKTTAEASAASVTMQAVGYIEETVTANRFSGDMLSYRAPASELQTKFSTSLQWHNISLHDKNFCYATLGFDKQPEVSDNGLILKAGETYTLEVVLHRNTSGAATTCELANLQFEYYVKEEEGKEVIFKPLDIEPIEPEESVYSQYLGNRAEYIWSMPRGCQRASIKLRAPGSRDAIINVLRIWGFKDSNSN